MASPSFANDFLIYWDNTNKELKPHVRDKMVAYGGRDYKLNMWHSICSTWDSESGLVQVWFDGQPSVKKFGISGTITETPTIILGQVRLQ